MFPSRRTETAVSFIETLRPTYSAILTSIRSARATCRTLFIGGADAESDLVHVERATRSRDYPMSMDEINMIGLDLAKHVFQVQRSPIASSMRSSVAPCLSMSGQIGRPGRRVFATLARMIAQLLTLRPPHPEKMLRIALLAVLVLLGAPPVGHGQPAKTTLRLCLLTFRPYALGKQPGVDKFFQTLRDLGYVDGRSIIIDYLSADGRNEQFPSLAAECLRREADVIVPATTPAAQAARDATQTIPIVMLPLGDPVGTGLVDSLARPGANVTGTSAMVTELAAKRLELLKEAVPGISRVLVLTYLIDPIAQLQVKSLKEASRSLGVTLQIHDIRTADDLPAAFDTAAVEGADGLIVTAETIFIVNRARVSELASRHRLPAIYIHPSFVRDGGLMSFSVDLDELERGSARYVDRVLKGEKPADLPIQQPTNFELVINLKTAKELGLTVPQSLLARADEVIE